MRRGTKHRNVYTVINGKMKVYGSASDFYSERGFFSVLFLLFGTRFSFYVSTSAAPVLLYYTRPWMDNCYES